VVIFDERVAKVYSEILNSLEVEINLRKSVVADVDTKRSEFAKRNFVNGIELTGLKADLVAGASKSLTLITQLFQTCDQRSMSLDLVKFRFPKMGDKSILLLSILKF